MRNLILGASLGAYGYVLWVLYVPERLFRKVTRLR
jgi:hypothetical protein